MNAVDCARQFASDRSLITTGGRAQLDDDATAASMMDTHIDHASDTLVHDDAQQTGGKFAIFPRGQPPVPH